MWKSGGHETVSFGICGLRVRVHVRVRYFGFDASCANAFIFNGYLILIVFDGGPRPSKIKANRGANERPIKFNYCILLTILVLCDCVFAAVTAEMYHLEII